MTAGALVSNPSNLSKTDPDWQFAIHIPGWARAKGSLEKSFKRVNGTLVQIQRDRDVVMQWVAKVAGHALRERLRREARGDTSFPFEAPVMLWPLFVYERPPTQPTGPPITRSGIYAVGDTDKLIRAVGDALSPGTFMLNRKKVAKGGVIFDDCLITRMGQPVKAFRDETIQYLPEGAHLFLTRAPEDLIDGTLYAYRPGYRWHSV